ncbi:helix-turn-helix domain-containing protein [Sphingomonas hankookensis]|uniref:helix-turn-helix domain-containing protein n=1 Tax=Sphingomonas hankookensis TaxID=563996 RepID=UPI001F582174|nr:helix-turn-helix domain-containing protein [Sphingomonas hankookensis]
MDDILTIRDVATRLKLGERTVTSMLADGELPGFKLRGQWRLRRDHFERWLAEVAAGGHVQSVTADIMGSVQIVPVAPDQERGGDEAALGADDGLSLLTEKVPQSELHRRFLQALGGRVRSHSDFDQKPMEADLAPPLPTRVRVYMFNATRPPGGRPTGEHKIQLIVPGQKRGQRANFDHSGGRIVLLAGYAAEDDVFVIWDAGLYNDFAWSRNVQVRAATIIEATAGKIAHQERRLRPGDGDAVTETLLACPPGRLADAIVKRVEMTRDRMAGA